MKDLLGFIRIMRPVNSIMVGFAIIVGVVIGGGKTMLESQMILAYTFLTGFLLSGSSMTINDYYDRDIDAINEPNRVIPSGVITPTEALVWSILLAITGLLAAYLTSWKHLVLAVIAWGASIFYATNTICLWRTNCRRYCVFLFPNLFINSVLYKHRQGDY